jgi:hypothetical protein
VEPALTWSHLSVICAPGVSGWLWCTWVGRAYSSRRSPHIIRGLYTSSGLSPGLGSSPPSGHTSVTASKPSRVASRTRQVEWDSPTAHADVENHARTDAGGTSVQGGGSRSQKRAHAGTVVTAPTDAWGQVRAGPRTRADPTRGEERRSYRRASRGRRSGARRRVDDRPTGSGQRQARGPLREAAGGTRRTGWIPPWPVRSPVQSRGPALHARHRTGRDVASGTSARGAAVRRRAAPRPDAGPGPRRRAHAEGKLLAPPDDPGQPEWSLIEPPPPRWPPRPRRRSGYSPTPSCSCHAVVDSSSSCPRSSTACTTPACEVELLVAARAAA